VLDPRGRVYKENGVANDLGKSSGNLLNQVGRKVVPHRNKIKLLQVRGEQSLVRIGLDVGSTAGSISDPAVRK
jgi:hypothetical protein